ncbi:hypothetical protein GGE12_001877 [Rhizobium mongolense]|uniref:Uncharacterized protein n=1 Tax=Rhizobium mongolense TaxID=57676 RepID=A0A7W6RKI1_9HYPH|nr:hypothetical protein [Rhizobium mongolense]
MCGDALVRPLNVAATGRQPRSGIRVIADPRSCERLEIQEARRRRCSSTLPARVSPSRVARGTIYFDLGGFSRARRFLTEKFSYTLAGEPRLALHEEPRPLWPRCRCARGYSGRARRFPRSSARPSGIRQVGDMLDLSHDDRIWSLDHDVIGQARPFCVILLLMYLPSRSAILASANRHLTTI